MTGGARGADARGALCERARAWAALAPDGELAELERKLLESHLARCGACSSFSLEAAAVAAELRSAPLEPLPRPIAVTVWRHRTAYARLQAVGAAAAVAVMALGIAARSPLSNGDRQSIQLPRVVDFSGGDRAELELLQSERLGALANFRNRPARHGGNQPV